MLTPLDSPSRAPQLNIVWFKRDLRVQDHAPLANAIRSANKATILGVYLFEPTLIQQPDVAGQHIGFALECLCELERDLRAINIPLIVVHADAVAFFAKVRPLFPKTQIKVFSHEETGNWASFQRDRALVELFKQREINWAEFPSHAVVRKLKNRDVWSQHWHTRMDLSPLEISLGASANNDYAVQQATTRTVHTSSLNSVKANVEHVLQTLNVAFTVVRLPGAFTSDSSTPSDTPTTSQPSHAIEQLILQLGPRNTVDKPARQRGGRSHALALLHSFFYERGHQYRKEMSSPLTAPQSCSRLSPYIAFGCVSIREIIHQVWCRRTELQAIAAADRPDGALQSLKSFESRLHWHCHFIQKLESEPEIEFRCVHSAFEGLRNAGALSEHEQSLLNAWSTGHTGFPIIDACMRMLRNTGWLNFRMRAMLVAFASYHLWLDWRHTALILAREFLDYEPGIHYPQFQMQSGVTGINTIRVYNPVKQAMDQDPDGQFIRYWVPELANVPLPFLAKPWEMPEMLQRECACVIGKDYPAPIVEHEQAARSAKEKLWAVKSEYSTQTQAKRVYEKHGSRHPNREGVRRKQEPKPEDENQLSLFAQNSTYTV